MNPLKVEVRLQHRQLAYTTDLSHWICLYGHMMTWSVSRYVYDLSYLDELNEWKIVSQDRILKEV
jgi:hypothetical protein